MADINRHPLIKQAYEVCQAIEAIRERGAARFEQPDSGPFVCSSSQTIAVSKASDLMQAIDDHFRNLPVPTATDLSLATTVELLQELKQRSKSLVVGIDPMADKSTFTVLRHGSKLSVSGLLRALTLDADNELANDPRDRAATE
nr:hypothetical protein [uncultured Rhodopila sp.]